MNDLALLANAPITITLAGHEFKVRKLTLSDMGKLQAWLKTKIPDPRLGARQFAEGLPWEAAVQIEARAAIEAQSWPPEIHSPEATRKLWEYEGMVVFLEVVMKPHQPTYGREQIEAIADRITPEEYLELWRAVSPGNPGESKKKATAEQP